MGRIFVSRFATIVNAYIYFSWKIISRIKLVPSGGDYSLSSRIPIYGGRNGEKLGGPWISPVNRHFIIGRPPWFFSLTPSSMPPTPLLLRVKEAPSWKNRQTDREGGERGLRTSFPLTRRKLLRPRRLIRDVPLPRDFRLNPDFRTDLLSNIFHYHSTFHPLLYSPTYTFIVSTVEESHEYQQNIHKQNSLKRKSSKLSKLILFHRIVGKYFAHTRKVRVSSFERIEERKESLRFTLPPKSTSPHTINPLP